MSPSGGFEDEALAVVEAMVGQGCLVGFLDVPLFALFLRQGDATPAERIMETGGMVRVESFRPSAGRTSRAGNVSG